MKVLNTLKYQYVPLFFTLKKEFSFEGTHITFFIDLDQKQRVQDISFQTSEPSNETQTFEDFNSFCETVWGQGLDSVLEVAAKRPRLYPDRIDYPLICFYSILNELKGLSPSSKQRVNQICRCFGISKSEIKELATKDLVLDLKSLSNHSLAGAACGSCLEDLKHYFFSIVNNANKRGFDSDKLTLKVGELSQADIVMNSQLIIDEWAKRESLREVNIESISGLEVFIYEDGEKLQREQLEFLSKLVSEKLGVSLTFIS